MKPTIKHFDKVEEFSSKSNNESVAQFDIALFDQSLAAELEDYENRISLPRRLVLFGTETETSLNILYKYRIPILCPEDLKKKYNDDLVAAIWKTWLSRPGWEINAKNKVTILVSLSSKPNWLNEEPFKKSYEIFDICYVSNSFIIGNESFWNDHIKTENIIMYDHHGSTSEDIPETKKIIYYSSMESGYGEQSLLQNFDPEKEEINETFFYKLIDACLSKVLIIDERVVEYIMNTTKLESKGHFNLALSNLYKNESLTSKTVEDFNYLPSFLSKTFIATSLQSTIKNKIQIGPKSSLICEIDLNRNPIAITYKDKEFSSAPIQNIDVVIVHKTYIVNLKESSQNKMIKDLNDKLGRLIIVSGGGQPHNIDKKGYGFIHLSSMLDCIGPQISKYKLIQHVSK